MFDPRNIYSKKFAAEAKRKHDMHQKILKNMKSSMNTRTRPPKLSEGKQHRLRMNKEREYAKIERENRQLLQRITVVSKKSCIDNKLPAHLSRARTYSKYLKEEDRRLKDEKIAFENEHMLHRIQSAAPAYNHLQWAEDARKHDQVLAHLCEYPVMDGIAAPSSIKAHRFSTS